MRNIKLILIGFIITINLSAQTNKTEVQLSGKIAEKYAITMILTINGENVLGYYFYDKYKTKILLEGQLIGDKITIKESPDYESEFKTGFIGILTHTVFTGEWIDKIKSNSLSCNLSVKTAKQMELGENILQTEGAYESVFNSENYSGSVDLKYITTDLFCFEIINATEAGCVGYLKGLIKLIDFKNGIYSVDSCENLEFGLTNNSLTLIEVNCDFHGMRCPFGGEYIKKQ